MRRRVFSRAFLLAAVFIAVLVGIRLFTPGKIRFVEFPLPKQETDRLFDVGIVDANGDDFLDIATSNHHFRQVLWIADGKGGYRDVLSSWGLDQSREFPLAELSYVPPEPDKPGVYVYWLGTLVVIRAYQMAQTAQWQGSLHVYDPVEVVRDDGFHAERRQMKLGVVTESTVYFAPKGDGVLILRPNGQGLPLDFRLTGGIQATQVFVGLGKASPDSTTFSLAMQDRHALAWADFNDDGVLDIFITRGALGGTLRALPEQVSRTIRDELLISRGAGRFEDVTLQAGMQKNGCSGRHSSWLDINQDGLLDLFVNCYDREILQGSFPKQVYRQIAGNRLQNMAREIGLDLADQQIGSYAWFDADDDGDPDLVAFQDDGLFIYRNNGGHFSQELILKRSSGDAAKIGSTTDAIWYYDGKITVADYDADGDLDFLSASRRGNALLKNEGGRFTNIDLAAQGLPQISATASWVDFDNDGFPDLHFVPQGLFRQKKDHSFVPTGMLALPPEQCLAAICNWFDLDNDGRIDVLMALNPDPAFKRWWEFRKQRGRPDYWELKAYRNVGASKHWIQIKLLGASGNRQAIGSKVTIITPAGTQTQTLGTSEGSFFSQGHYRLYFGLGDHSRIDVLKVRWPHGVQQELRDVAVDRLLTIECQLGH